MGPSSMSVSNLKQISLFVQKLWGGPKISKFGHVTQATPTIGIKFTQWKKKHFRCTDTCDTWHGWRVTRSALACEISPKSVGYTGLTKGAPKSRKFSLFGKESPRRGEPLGRFLQVVGYFCVQLPCKSVTHLTWFVSGEKTLIFGLWVNLISVVYRFLYCR